jgi:hypothetical protein
MRGHWVPVTELLVESLHVFFPLSLLILALPPLFQNGNVIVDSTTVVVDAVLLCRSGGRGRIRCARRHNRHERLLDGRAGFLGLGALDVVWVVKVGSCTFT